VPYHRAVKISDNFSDESGPNEQSANEQSANEQSTHELGQVSRRSLMAVGATAGFATVGLATLGLLPWTASSSEAAARAGYEIEYVSFDDIAPPYLTLTQSWNALGMDNEDRVYIIWTSKRTDGREDSALFRYTPTTGHREFLGTFIDTATAQNNLLPGEEIPKGHTRILQIGRKMYLASQGFHDFKGSLETLPNYRGSHLFTFDLDTNTLDDVTRTLPGGVLTEHQGIVALAHAPEHDTLVALTHPHSDIVLYDLKTKTIRKTVPGIPWEPNRVVSREIVVTPQGKIFTYRGPEDPALRDDRNRVWVYDLTTDTMKKTGQSLKGGFWNGQASTPDRRTIYLSTVSGQLYALDTRKGTFTDLGHFTDPKDYNRPEKYRVHYLYGIALNTAGTALTGLPIIAPTAGDGDAYTRLTTYNIKRKTFTKDIDATTTVFTGSNTRDREGNIYMAAFEWDHDCKLAILRPR
jgi:hypothetical protein